MIFNRKTTFFTCETSKLLNQVELQSVFLLNSVVPKVRQTTGAHSLQLHCGIGYEEITVSGGVTENLAAEENMFLLS